MREGHQVRCGLCGSLNEIDRKLCEICDSELVCVDESLQPSNSPHLRIGRAQQLRFSLLKGYQLFAFAPKHLFFIISLACFVCGLLGFYCLQTPLDVQQSRQNFSILERSYAAQRDKWDFQKDEIVQAMYMHRMEGEVGKEALNFEAIPLEIIYAFLLDHIEFKDALAISFCDLKDDPKIILSKRAGFLGLHMLSLSIQIQSIDKRLKIEPISLRRGRIQLNKDKINRLFARELSALRVFENYYGGLSDLKIDFSHHEGASKKRSVNALLSWKYFHDGVFSS